MSRAADGPGSLRPGLAWATEAAPGRAPFDDRLWGTLAHRTKRSLPARGLDVASERVRGWMARRRAPAALRRRAEGVLRAALELRTWSDAALDARTGEVREDAVLRRGGAESVDRAYAHAAEVVRRELGLELHAEQVMGALAMSDGHAVEMATGEGKTVTAVLPAVLDAWGGRGVHVITVNDYLARRDASICGPVYARLGVRVGVVQDGSRPAERREAYGCDVTYAADKQVIFDFLRDRLASPLNPRLAGHVLETLCGTLGPGGPGWHERVVQRGLFSAIVDEADSVLIDEAVTPAIVSTEENEGSSASEHAARAAELAGSLRRDEHYRVDERLHRVYLTSDGREKLESLAGSLPAFWSGPRRREELVTQALTAKELYRLGDDYIVRDGKIVIVDRSTGRVLEGRQWQLGLHQAVEAKEGLAHTPERLTGARVSYQRFFQRYRRLCGMSGTLWEVGPELWEWYRLRVVRIPTHRPVRREHLGDRVFENQSAKFDGAAAEVERWHRLGRPVLVGTRSVESSERLGELLERRGIACRILNATREPEEAAIVEEAGRVGAVTVATNMAGRGTDIKLGPGAGELGGLVVIATERHEESRVDRQLFGRSGRQGDPGLAMAFVSLDDRLIQRHGLRPLVWLCRRTRGVARRWLARTLWRSSQHAAGRVAAMMRTDAARSEAWIDMALHQQTR